MLQVPGIFKTAPNLDPSRNRETKRSTFEDTLAYNSKILACGQGLQWELALHVLFSMEEKWLDFCW